MIVLLYKTTYLQNDDLENKALPIGGRVVFLQIINHRCCRFVRIDVYPKLRFGEINFFTSEKVHFLQIVVLDLMHTNLPLSGIRTVLEL
jgi:hypothetical protein